MPSGFIDPTVPPPPPYTEIAVPDGSADCTRALNDALQRSRDSGRPVGLRPGRYVVTDTLHVGGAALVGYYRAPFKKRPPWDTIWDPALDPRTRIMVRDDGIAGAFRDGVIVAGRAATMLAGFELVCEQRPASFDSTYYWDHRASWFRVDQGIHIASDNSIIRDVQVAGAGRVCFHIEGRGTRIENCPALYAMGDGFWIANANGSSFNRVQVRYCDGTTPIFVRGNGYNTGYSILERAAPQNDPGLYHAAGGCVLRSVNVEQCSSAVAQLKILDTRALVLVSGGWFEGNGGDGFVLEEAVGARIRDIRMGGDPPHVAVHIKGDSHCWSNQVKGLAVANQAYAQIKVQNVTGYSGRPHLNVLDEWQPTLDPYQWSSKSNKFLSTIWNDTIGLGITWYG